LAKASIGGHARKKTLDCDDAREAFRADDAPEVHGAGAARGERLVHHVATGDQGGRAVASRRNLASVLHCVGPVRSCASRTAGATAENVVSPTGPYLRAVRRAAMVS